MTKFLPKLTNFYASFAKQFPNHSSTVTSLKQWILLLNLQSEHFPKPFQMVRIILRKAAEFPKSPPRLRNLRCCIAAQMDGIAAMFAQTLSRRSTFACHVSSQMEKEHHFVVPKNNPSQPKMVAIHLQNPKMFRQGNCVQLF
jgi:hypothetical protein